MDSPFCKTPDFKQKYSNYAFLVYPEWDNYIDILKQAMLCGARYYLSPLHDKDIIDKGDRKGQPDKPHYHLLLLFPNQRYPKPVMELIGFQFPNLVEVCGSPDSFIRYLCHKGWEDKYQYNPEEIQTNDQKRVVRAYTDKCEDDLEGLSAIRGFLSENPFAKPLDIAIWCETNGYSHIYRKYQYTIIQSLQRRFEK